MPNRRQAIIWVNYGLVLLRIYASPGLNELNLIPGWFSYYFNFKVWYEMMYPFPNFYSCSVEVCELVSDFIVQSTVHVITVYPKKYAHGFVVLCFVVVTQSFTMNSHEVFIHIHQGCFAGTGAIVRLPQCQWSKPDGYGKISQCITTTKHSKAKTVCIFLGIYCTYLCLDKR